MKQRIAIIGLAVALGYSPVPADVELTLVDGRKIEGVDVRREGDSYVLAVEDGSQMVLPVALVRQVRIRERGRPAPHPGVDVRRPGVVAGNELPESAAVVDGPQALVGPQIEPPQTRDQLEVFGEPSRFKEDIVDNRWTPRSDWDMDPDENNNWAPSTWSTGPIDPGWTPESAFPSGSTLEGRESKWRKSIIDHSWKPQDGFSKSSR